MTNTLDHPARPPHATAAPEAPPEAPPPAESYADCLSPIEDIIEEARQGRMFILIDDEERENEGDLVIPAAKADAEAVNFMAKHGRGLICLAMQRERVEQLGLPLMTRNNASRHQTAFTISIEAREGVTTGISAADRARTIAVAIDPAHGRADIATPGHVFPLLARDGGVLERAGHTEAAMDIARMAGLPPAGVVCEVMNDDGSMARLPDLVGFAQYHGLKIAAIADLIAYRKRTERFVERVAESAFDSRYGGDWRLMIYRNAISGDEHIALVKGDVATGAPVLARMHAFDVLDEVLGEANTPHGGDLPDAMRMIAKAGRGVVVVIRESRQRSLAERLHAKIEARAAPAEAEASMLRDYGVGAQILLDLGVRELTLLSSSDRHVVGLRGYGLTIVERRPIMAP